MQPTVIRYVVLIIMKSIFICCQQNSTATHGTSNSQSYDEQMLNDTVQNQITQQPVAYESKSKLSTEQIKKIIEREYTKNNVLDGSEYASVDSLSITRLNYKKSTNTYHVAYFIVVSYQAAAMPQEYQSEPPTVKENGACIIRNKNTEWIFENRN